jgi:iron-sulfur cluster assembly protein
MPSSTPVISFTTAAASHIKSLLKQNPNAKGFRLSVKKGGCTGYSYLPTLAETESEADLYWKEPAGFLVYIDPKVVNLLKGTVLDFEDKGLGQTQLIFKNPNVKDSCGCGDSFNV